MKIIDYMRGRGVQPERFLFMPTNKTFGFGGVMLRGRQIGR